MDTLPTDFEPAGRGFESLHARHVTPRLMNNRQQAGFQRRGLYWGIVPDSVPTPGE